MAQAYYGLLLHRACLVYMHDLCDSLDRIPVQKPACAIFFAVAFMEELENQAVALSSPATWSSSSSSPLSLSSAASRTTRLVVHGFAN